MQTESVVESRAKVWRSDFLVLCLIVAASFALRLAAMIHWGTGAIESEGAEYARIAENLRKGVGYVGIVTPGPELMFPPLFPALIYVFSFVTGSYAAAGRLVSLVLGTLLPLPVYGIASRLFSNRVGIVAAGLVTLHPLFINLSFTVLTEGPYAILLLSAIYVVLRALYSPSLLMWSLVGAAFGVTYLLRPEAAAPLAIAVILELTAAEEKPFIRCQRAIVALVVFLIVASPEVIFIYRTTGKLRLETKSAITTPLAVLVLRKEASLEAAGGPAGPQGGEALKWASAAIDGDLRRIGIWLRPEVEVMRDKVTREDFVRLVAKAIRQNTPTLLDSISSRWMGAPFLTALALLGAVRRPWPRRTALGHLYFILVPVTAILASFVVLWIFPRYYFVLVPFLLIWAANGLIETWQWTKASITALHCHGLSPTVAAYVVSGSLALAVILYPLHAIRSLYEFTEGSTASRAAEDAGLWIKQQQTGSVTIMDRSTPLAFHADAQFVYFPYCSGDLALRFLDAAKVDYVVLRRQEKFTNYYEDWLAHGIPNSRAQLVYVSSGAAANDIIVYRWHHL
jgi:4-amino-4-deoxy-L-arabinose transferase-like glycosyltransferase